jgi:hypothetical protein
MQASPKTRLPANDLPAFVTSTWHPATPGLIPSLSFQYVVTPVPFQPSGLYSIVPFAPGILLAPAVGGPLALAALSSIIAGMQNASSQMNLTALAASLDWPDFILMFPLFMFSFNLLYKQRAH